MDWWAWGLVYLAGGCLTMLVWAFWVKNADETVVALGIVWPLVWLFGVFYLWLWLGLQVSRRRGRWTRKKPRLREPGRGAGEG